MTVSNKGLDYINVLYTFNFQAKNDIPNNGSIILTFPTEYKLVLSDPKPIY